MFSPTRRMAKKKKKKRKKGIQKLFKNLLFDYLARINKRLILIQNNRVANEHMSSRSLVFLRARGRRERKESCTKEDERDEKLSIAVDGVVRRKKCEVKKKKKRNKFRLELNRKRSLLPLCPPPRG